MIRQLAACEREYDRAIDLAPDQPMFKALKGEITPMKTADECRAEFSACNTSGVYGR
jgi:hypothetical protein